MYVAPQSHWKELGFADDLYRKEFLDTSLALANPRLEKLITTFTR